MAKITLSKLNFMMFLFVVIVLLTATINIAQTKEEIDIDSKAKELGITTTELQGILNSALRNGGGGDPQPEALTKRFFTGQAADDQFGISVSTAGDVNGTINTSKNLIKFSFDRVFFAIILLQYIIVFLLIA